MSYSAIILCSLVFSGAVFQEASGHLIGKELMHWKGITADWVGLFPPLFNLWYCINLST